MATASHTRTSAARRRARPALAFALGALAWSSSAVATAFVTQVPSGRDDLALFALVGEITGGETLELTRLVSQLPSNRTVTVILHSPGGNLTEGLALGRFFHKARISTLLLGDGGRCASACATAFLGGRDRQGRPSRTKMRSSQLGFHQFFARLTGDTTKLRFSKEQMEQRVVQTHGQVLELIAYLSDIGEELDKLDLMLAVPGTALRYVTNEEAATYGINVVNERDNTVIEASNVRARSDR